MARPKECIKSKVASAYEEKCMREAEKVEQKLASLLRHDMLQLLDNGYLADIEISTPCKTSFKAHKCLIKARSPQVWHDVLKNPEQTSSVTLNVDQPQHVFQVLRFIYGEDNITAIEELLNECDEQVTERDPFEPTVQEQHAIEVEGLNLRACCPLGTDILRMYLQGEDHDVTLRINSTKFKAHKCILCARSGYFAAMLSGSWSESSQDDIELIGVSPKSLKQILLYMYGAVPELETSQSNLTHILASADMYGLCGLKERVAYCLRRYYCHFFHKPCTDCINGVLFTLSLASTYGLEDLWSRGLKWVAKYFARVWSTKQFSLLPDVIKQKCAEACISGISFRTVVEIIMECDCLLGSLSSVRWSEPVVILANQVMEACRQYLSSNLPTVINASSFTSLGTTMALGLSFLADVLCDSIRDVPHKNACKAYVAISSKADACNREDCSWNEDFKEMILKLNKSMTAYMQTHLHQLLSLPQWHSVLTTQMQTSIKEGASYVAFEDLKSNYKPNGSIKKKPSVQMRAKSSRLKDRPVKTLSLPSNPSSQRNGEMTLSKSNVQSLNSKKGRPKTADHLFERIESSSSLMTVCSTAVTVNSDLSSPSSDLDLEPEPVIHTDSLLFPLVWTFETPTRD